jgi:hypothetical protein
MVNQKRAYTITPEEIDSFLVALKASTEEFEIITVSMFTQLIHIGITGLILGRKWKGTNHIMYLIFQQFIEHSVVQNYIWFLTWVEKLDIIDQEQETLNV